jgi:transcriptional regulator with XRE-family HTH domain
MTNKPNWQEMIHFLLNHYTQKQIESKTDIDQSTISKIKNGKPYNSPTYESGSKLIRMYDFTIYREQQNEKPSL